MVHHPHKVVKLVEGDYSVTDNDSFKIETEHNSKATKEHLLDINVPKMPTNKKAIRLLQG